MSAESTPKAAKDEYEDNSMGHAHAAGSSVSACKSAEIKMSAESTPKAAKDEYEDDSMGHAHAAGLSVSELLHVDSILKTLAGIEEEDAGSQSLPDDLYLADKEIEKNECKIPTLWIGQTRAARISSHVPLVPDQLYHILDEQNRIWQLVWQEESRSFNGWMWPQFLQANDVVQGDRIRIVKAACQNRLRIIKKERPRNRNGISLASHELVVYNRSQKERQQATRKANVERRNSAMLAKLALQKR